MSGLTPLSLTSVGNVTMAKLTEPANLALPMPKDLSHHFSEVTKNRQPSAIKEYYKFFKIPGIGNLAGGKRHKPSFCLLS